MELTFEISTQAHYDIKSKRKLAVSKATEPQPDTTTVAVKKRGPGRPPNPSPKKKRAVRKAPTMLRRDRPVETSIPMDVWESVLSFSTLDKLLKLRELCSTFRSALQQERVWRLARIRQFGLDHPDPPKGITEMQYADLLVGIGCHGADCNAKDTRRTYWAYRRRWCETCLGKNLVRGRQARDELQMYTDLSQCLPQGRYDSWGHYQSVGISAVQTFWQAPSSTSVAYSRFDIRQLNERITAFKKREPVEDELRAWIDDQHQQNKAFVRELQSIEHWLEVDRREREVSRGNLRGDRIAFFRERAQEMQPPMSAEALSLCDSYLRSIRIAKPPSKKSWQKLVPKLQDERIDAERRARKLARTNYHRRYRDYLREEYESTLEQRRGGQSSIQHMVLVLARQVIEQVVQRSFEPGDFALRVLRGVYDAYEAKPKAEKPLNRMGPYRLIMDDARLIFRQCIVPEAHKRFRYEDLSHATNFKCPATACRGRTQLRSFLEMMTHLYEEHRYSPGFECLLETTNMYGELSMSFPWFRLEWPRNLPLLAWYSGWPDSVWDIDSEEPPVYHVPGQANTEPVVKDVFQDCHPSTDPMLGQDLASSIVAGMTVMKSTTLPQADKIKIVLEFAQARIRLLRGQQFFGRDELQRTLCALSNAELAREFDGQQCYHCLYFNESGPPQNFDARRANLGTSQSNFALTQHGLMPGVHQMHDLPRSVTRRLDFAHLIGHYTREHLSNPSAWLDDLMVLPHGREIHAALDRDESGDAWARFRTLFVARSF